MHPDWQAVRHLGLIAADVQSLQPVLPLLRQALPAAQITLLTTAPDPAIVPPVSNMSIALLQQDAIALIDSIRSLALDAVVIFTAPDRSPYVLAYLCYLAGVPIRVGQSQEFGGSVLSSCITPPLDATVADYHLHLLQSLELIPNSEDAVDRAKAAIDSEAPRIQHRALNTQHSPCESSPGTSTAATFTI